MGPVSESLGLRFCSSYDGGIHVQLTVDDGAYWKLCDVIADALFFRYHYSLSWTDTWWYFIHNVRNLSVVKSIYLVPKCAADGETISMPGRV